MSAIDTGNQEQFDNFTTSHLGLEPKVFESIISLERDKSDLWAALRHSYKSIINKGLKLFNFEHFDYESIN